MNVAASIGISIGTRICEIRVIMFGGRDRIQRFRIADGSADEVKTHLLTALAWGWIEEHETVDALACGDSLLAITWTLTH